MPAEREPYDRTLMGWPCRRERGRVDRPGVHGLRRVANAIAIRARHDDTPIPARTQPTRASRAAPASRWSACTGRLVAAHCGPIYVRDSNGQRYAVHLRFNAGGEGRSVESTTRKSAPCSQSGSGTGRCPRRSCSGPAHASTARQPVHRAVLAEPKPNPRCRAMRSRWSCSVPGRRACTCGSGAVLLEDRARKRSRGIDCGVHPPRTGEPADGRRGDRNDEQCAENRSQLDSGGST